MGTVAVPRWAWWISCGLTGAFVGTFLGTLLGIGVLSQVLIALGAAVVFERTSHLVAELMS